MHGETLVNGGWLPGWSEWDGLRRGEMPNDLGAKGWKVCSDCPVHAMQCTHRNRIDLGDGQVLDMHAASRPLATQQAICRRCPCLHMRSPPLLNLLGSCVLVLQRWMHRSCMPCLYYPSMSIDRYNPVHTVSSRQHRSSWVRRQAMPAPTLVVSKNNLLMGPS